MSGIYITSLNPTGPAATDGRIEVGDRILKVDGHSLRGLENMEAAAVIRNSGNPVKLVLSRKHRKPSTPTTADVSSPAGSHDPMSESHDPMSESHDLISGAEFLGNGPEERDGPCEGGEGGEGGEATRREVMERWSKVLGPDYIVKVGDVIMMSLRQSCHCMLKAS